MPAKILFVDDDANILAGFQRHLRKIFDLETALGAKDGLNTINEKGPFSVIVSDLRMPGMDGIQFLSRVRERTPDSIRMMLTGCADMQTAIDAVNQGNIFRFLTKPCESDVLVKALSEGVRQYNLVTAERELLEKTLRGSLKVLSEILELVNPEAFGRASRITHYVREIGNRMRVADIWQLETAASLSQIGCVILPEDALRKLYQGQELTGEESQLFSMHPFIASDLLAHIPRMETVTEIIADQEKNFDGSGIPMDSRRGEEIPLGARILKVVLDFDTLHVKGVEKSRSVEQMAVKAGLYDPEVLLSLEEVVKSEARFRKAVLKVEELRDDMVISEDVLLRNGRLLVARGYKVNRTLRERLRSFSEKPGIREPVEVLIPMEWPNIARN
jgi:response regulator RpfG family c-di-GMP phosphodiesterase